MTDMLLSMWTFAPFQRAMIAGLLLAVSCGLVGSFVVVRKEALIGHSLSHLSFLGIVLGLLFAVPLPLTVVLCLAAGVLVLSLLMEREVVARDSAMEYTAQVSMALAIIGLQFFTSYQVDPMQYLFGDILVVGPTDVWVAGGVLALVLLALIPLYKPLLQVSLDRELARSTGMRLWLVDLLFLALVAAVVYAGMKILGIILLGGFLIIPANIGKHLGRSFRGYMAWSVVMGLLAVVLGLMLSFLLDAPSGPTIVVLMGFVLLLMTVFRR